jgi:hypothetical protein
MIGQRQKDSSLVQDIQNAMLSVAFSHIIFNSFDEWLSMIHYSKFY